MDPMRTLEDLEALRLLKARYFRLVDTRQWAAWGELFEPDVTADFSADQPGMVLRSRGDLVRQVSEVLGAATTVHQGYMPELEILTPTTARGVWAMEDRLEWPATAPGGPRSVHGWGHYAETYRKSEAGWRIASLVLTRLRVVNS